MNHPIRRVALAAMVMILALMVNISVSYVVRSDALDARPENRRVTDARFGTDRGPIMVANAPIAKSVAVKDQYRYQRVYPSGVLYAPVTGYYTYQYGASALEASYSAQLSGQDSSQFLARLISLATGSKAKGGTVETTISGKAQQAAWKALNGRKGAVVAIDYRTGAIKALVSSPSYDPNALATHNLKQASKAWKALNADPKKPMSNRATREIYQPGSTFKLVTAATALESGMTPSSTVNGTAYKLPGSTKKVPGCGSANLTLTKALEVSCNPAFARLGVQLGQDKLRDQSQKFGFGTKFLTDIGSVPSVFPNDLDSAQTALVAFGQYDVAATPLQMAMVSAAIANNGVLMEPYVVNRVMDSDLRVISQTTPKEHGRALSTSSAAAMQQMMVDVVNNGTGHRAQISGVKVGGKTGTATNDAGRSPYAWFTAWSDDPHIAVCAFVEDAGIPAQDIAGGRVAAPIAKSVIESLR